MSMDAVVDYSGQFVQFLIVLILVFAVVNLYYLLRGVLIRKKVVEQTTAFRSKKFNLIFLCVAVGVCVIVCLAGASRLALAGIFCVMFVSLTALQILYFVLRTVLERIHKI